MITKTIKYTVPVLTGTGASIKETKIKIGLIANDIEEFKIDKKDLKPGSVMAWSPEGGHFMAYDIKKDLEGAVELNESHVQILSDKIDLEVSKTKEYANGLYNENRAFITLTADNIRSEVSAIENTLDGKISTNTSSITQSATEIRSEVSAMETLLDGKISQNTSSITQTALEIRSEVNAHVDDLDDKIITNTSLITQTATEIRSEVSSIETALDGKISSNTSAITQTATEIRSEVATLEETVNGLSSNSSSITQTAEEIRAEVAAIEQDLNGKISTNTSSITQTASDIRSEVSAIETTLDGKINTNTTSINQTANDIQLKASMDNATKASIVVSNINNGSVKIAAKNIQIDGTTTFSSGYDPSTKETPSGAQAKANTALTDAKSYADSSYNSLADSLGDLAYSDLVEKAKLGTTIIDGGYIKADLISATTINALTLTINKGTLGGFSVGSTYLMSNNNATRLNSDGSGHFAEGNFSWDKFGNITLSSDVKIMLKGDSGENGHTPYIQGNYWYVDGSSTGVKALGEDGNDGNDGHTPTESEITDTIINNSSVITPSIISNFVGANRLTADNIIFDNATGTNMNLTGIINATSGSFGEMDIVEHGFNIPGGGQKGFYFKYGDVADFGFYVPDANQVQRDVLKFQENHEPDTEGVHVSVELRAEQTIVFGKLQSDYGVDIVSDRKWKENIKPSKSIDKLIKLNPVDFTFKKGLRFKSDSKIQHGFIAQEIQDVYPELIDTRTDGSLSVNYTGMISENTSGIISNYKSIEKLENEVEILKDEVTDLKDQVRILMDIIKSQNNIS